MLDTFRNLIKGWLGKVLIAIFILPFAFIGVSSIFQSSGIDNSVATVNGSGIDERDLLNAIDMQRQSLVSRFGDQFPKDMLSVESLRPNVLNGMIGRELLTQYADKNGHFIGLESVHEEIRGSTTFQQDGVFSNDLFEQLIRRAGMSPNQFMDELRKDKKGDQVRDGYFNTDFATELEITQLLKLNEQQRDISYLQIPLHKVKGKVVVTDDEIEQYFEENRDRYKVSEQVALEYIELRLEDFGADIEVTEEDITTQFAVRVAEIEATQNRDASHILIEVGADLGEDQARNLAGEMHKRLSDGEDFAALAKEYSSDAGSAEKGGNLGLAGRGAYDAEFEKALFDLEVGAISAPVLTEFGFHIIKLNGVEPPVPELETIRQSLHAEVKVTKAEQPFNDKVEELKEVAFAASDLQDPADLLGVEIKHTGYFTRSGGSGIGTNKEVVEAAFGDEVLNEKRNSEVIEFSAENKVVVVRVKGHKPETYKALEKVQVPIKLAIESEKSKERIKELGEGLMAKVKAGDFKDEDIKDLEISWVDKKSIKRNDAGVPREIAQKAFTLPRNFEKEAIEGMSLNNGDYVIVKLDAVIEGKESANESDEKKQQMADVLGGQKGQFNFQNLTTWLRDSADVEEM